MKRTSLVLVVLILTGGISCSWQEEQQREREAPSPCDRSVLLSQYPNSGGNPPWVYGKIDEWLENDYYGNINKCSYKNGIGYLFEHFENRNELLYSFRNCEGEILYQGKKNPIDAYSELNIKFESLILKKYPSWELEKSSDEFLCNVINPFTLHRVKEMLHRCSHHRCFKSVSICTYRDGVGFLLWEHLNAGYNAYWEFLDCSGNLLCGKSQENLLDFPTEFDIDYQNQKLLLHLFISLTGY